MKYQNLEYTFLILASNCPVKFWRSQKNLFFLSPQFRYFLNVWNIKNLEYNFLIWAGNCRVKFWRSPKNFKKINFCLLSKFCAGFYEMKVKKNRLIWGFSKKISLQLFPLFLVGILGETMTSWIPSEFNWLLIKLFSIWN